MLAFEGGQCGHGFRIVMVRFAVASLYVTELIFLRIPEMLKEQWVMPAEIVHPSWVPDRWLHVPAVEVPSGP